MSNRSIVMEAALARVFWKYCQARLTWLSLTPLASVSLVFATTLLLAMRPSSNVFWIVALI
jgi:hypothetical protein